MTIVRDVSEVEALPHDRRVNGLLRRDEIRFEIPEVSSQRQVDFQSRLNRYQARCGCVAATVCFLSALGAGVMWLSDVDAAFWSWRFAAALGLVVIATLVATTLGKLTAMAVTQLQFRRACRSIQRELQGA